MWGLCRPTLCLCQGDGYRELFSSVQSLVIHVTSGKCYQFSSLALDDSALFYTEVKRVIDFFVLGQGSRGKLSTTLV